MSAVDVAPIAVDPATDDDDLTHVVCCEDLTGTIAFCGTDVSDEPFRDTPIGDPDNCIVCAEMEGGNWCPRYRRCPLADPP